MIDYKNLKNLSSYEESRNILLSHWEVSECIDLLEGDIKVQSEWLDKLETKVKISANSYNTNEGVNYSIHSLVERTEDFIKHSRYRIELLQRENLTLLN